MSGTDGLTSLEDRLLVLKDQVDSLSKAFDPNQPRDKDGKWADGPGGGDNVVNFPKPTYIVEDFWGGDTTLDWIEDDAGALSYAEIFYGEDGGGTVVRRGRAPEQDQLLIPGPDGDLVWMSRKAADDFEYGMEELGAGFRLVEATPAEAAAFHAKEDRKRIPGANFAEHMTTVFGAHPQAAQVIQEYRDDLLAGRKQGTGDRVTRVYDDRGFLRGYKASVSVQEGPQWKALGDVTVDTQGRVVDTWQPGMRKVVSLSKAFDPNQPRDNSGKWSETGGGAAAPAILSTTNWRADDFRMAYFDEPSEDAIKKYNDIVRIRPADFKRGFLGPATDSDINMADGIGDWLSFSSVLAKGNTGLGTIIRSLFKDNNQLTAGHDSFELFKNKQGMGYAKGILGSQMGLWQKLGVHQVNLEANVDVGGYAWAKYGFLPGSSMWRDLSQQVGNRIVAAGRKGMFDATALNAFDKVIKSPNPKAVWALADMKYPVNYYPVRSALQGGGVLHPGYHNTKLDTLGKYALANTHWLGALELNNPEQMGRFNAYIGKR